MSMPECQSATNDREPNAAATAKSDKDSVTFTAATVTVDAPVITVSASVKNVAAVRPACANQPCNSECTKAASADPAAPRRTPAAN